MAAAVVDGLGDEPHQPDAAAAVHQVDAPRHLHTPRPSPSVTARAREGYKLVKKKRNELVMRESCRVGAPAPRLRPFPCAVRAGTRTGPRARGRGGRSCSALRRCQLRLASWWPMAHLLWSRECRRAAGATTASACRATRRAPSAPTRATAQGTAQARQGRCALPNWEEIRRREERRGCLVPLVSGHGQRFWGRGLRMAYGGGARTEAETRGGIC